MRILLVTVTALFLTGCTTLYHVPTVGTTTNLTLTKADLDIVGDLKGEGKAMGLFPFYLFAATPLRAQDTALTQATVDAYERGGVDFLLQPRIKTTYYNFLIVDYARSEVNSKGARIR